MVATHIIGRHPRRRTAATTPKAGKRIVAVSFCGEWCASLLSLDGNFESRESSDNQKKKMGGKRKYSTEPDDNLYLKCYRGVPM